MSLEKIALHLQSQLSPHAARSTDCNRLDQESADPFSYQQDVLSILHCKAYSRYMDKTQVIYLVQQDHVTKRALHVQLVSHLARSIGRMLNLNIDLIEAISLGHDVGHPPFGHEGEGYLSEISISYGEGPFAHSAQSCRLLDVIEPLNLGLAVYDGFLCHDGNLQETHIVPQANKTWQQHRQEYLYKQAHPDDSITPMTLEGCLVKICDTMSYVTRDLEDAVRLKLIDPKEIPLTPLGNSPRKILDYFAEDLITESLDKPYIRISQESDSLLRSLRKLNYSHFYFHPGLKAESEKIRRGYRILCDFLLEEYARLRDHSLLFEQFLATKSPQYLEGLKPTRAVIDFVAGMTDGFFLRTLQNCLIPSSIKFP